MAAWVKSIGRDEVSYELEQVIGSIPVLAQVVEIPTPVPGLPPVWGWGVMDHRHQIRRDGVARDLKAAQARAEAAARSVAAASKLN